MKEDWDTYKADSRYSELMFIVNSMDVPEGRKTHIRWLHRNLGLSEENRNHPKFGRSQTLIKELLLEYPRIIQ